MKGAALIPYDEIERLPAVSIDKAPLRRKLNQNVQKPTPVTHLKIFDARGMGTQVRR